MFAFLQKLASCGPLLARAPEDEDEAKKIPMLPTMTSGVADLGAAQSATNPHVALYAAAGFTPSPANPHLHLSFVNSQVAEPAAPIAEGAPTPRTTAAAESAARDAIQSALTTLADGDAPRSEYLEYWAPSSFMQSALPSKSAFEESLKLPWGARCMLERQARGVVDADVTSSQITRI
jgi:hypothetical protein